MSIKLPTTKTMIAQAVTDYIMLFYGPAGTGKTTFVENLADKVLFLSTDRGTRFFPALRVECNYWEDFQEVLDLLEKPGAPKYDAVAVDFVDDWANAAERHVCDRNQIETLSDMSHGKAWSQYKSELRGFCQRLLALGTGVVFIAHEKIATVKSRGIELNRTMPDMGKNAWNTIIPAADLIGYCGFRTLQERGSTIRKEIRVLETVPREDLHAKDRTKRRRPPEGYDLLDGSKFIQTFAAGNTATGDSHGASQSSIQLPNHRSPQPAGRRSRAVR